jgi:hypothetical protein
VAIGLLLGKTGAGPRGRKPDVYRSVVKLDDPPRGKRCG